MRRTFRRSVWLLATMELVVSCGGGSTVQVAEDTSTTRPSSTTTSASPQTPKTTTTTSLTTITTLPTTTTTSTVPPSPEELRADFVQTLDAEGWVEYSEPVKGWSIRYPEDWEVVVVVDNPDDSTLTFGLAAADGGLLLVAVGLDALEDSGSSDYLQKSIEYSVNQGTLNPPGDNDWFWLDHDFDGVEGPLDIAGVQASLVSDPLTGDTIPEGAIAPTWWFGYYNPEAHPDYGYIFQTVGTNQAFFNVVDSVVMSFVPPEQ